ncbi:TPA: hypothetical protein ACH3X2_001364 [Trebouxia sp. C0005]
MLARGEGATGRAVPKFAVELGVGCSRAQASAALMTMGKLVKPAGRGKIACSDGSSSGTTPCCSVTGCEPATNSAPSARIDRWLVSDSLLSSVSAPSVTDLTLSDRYGVAVTVSPAKAPPAAQDFGQGLLLSFPILPSLMDLDLQHSKSAAQGSSSSLPALVAISMQAADGASTSAVPAAVADPALVSGPTPADTPMLPAVPLLVSPDLPDTAASSAMCLWAEDVDIPVDIVKQAVLHVHANFASELSQHLSTDCTCLSKPGGHGHSNQSSHW